MNEKIKEFVEEVLREDSKARDNDIWLVLQTLKKMGFNIYINYSEIESMPSFETITRIRREIQNTEGRLGPSEAVEEKRQKHQRELKDYFSTRQLNPDTYPGSNLSF